MVQRALASLFWLFLLFAPTTSLARPATGAAPSAPVDGGWPRAYITSSGGRLTLYQPQVVSWDDQKRIVMYAAVSYTAKDEKTQALGTIRLEARTSVALAERLVSFSDFAITSVNFPGLSREQTTAVVADVNTSVPQDDRVIGLDRVLAAMDTAKVKPHNLAGVKADPPLIFYSTTPTVLVNIDGNPIWSPIRDTDLKFAVNTNWDLFEQPSTTTLFLRVDSEWLKAPGIEGPWTPAGKLPDSFSKLPDDGNWSEAKAAMTSAHGVGKTTPTVLVSRKPAELILVHGAPAYTPVAGTNLIWLSNTDSDVFRVGKTGPIYFLVSGRWFSAPAFTGPWTFATPSLPADFARIPLDHPRSRVLASVPGTTQALEAVLLAQVPQTARVSRTETKAPDVVFQGNAEFEAIENTTISRAVNTDKDIIKVGNNYYLCFDGVWFVAERPDGPWVLADSVPEEIYKIPISSPAYNVTNVTVESADQDAVVYAAAAAYTGMMVAWDCAVWGTGWYYPPYVWWDGYYPVYYPRYPSYGYGAWYNPWNGSYTRAGAAYGPYGGVGYAARYNPKTGT